MAVQVRGTHFGWSLVVAVGLALGAGGCGKEQGSVQTQAPLQAKLGTYDTIVISAAAADAANAAHTDRLAHAIKAGLESRGTFANVVVGEPAPEAGVSLQVTLVSLDQGSEVARTMNLGGESEMTVDCKLVELGSDKALGTFSATGNSSRKVQTSINGVNTGIADDLTGRAIMATADQVAQFLTDNK